MPTYAIVLGVFPTTPQSAADFVSNYLTGLKITAYDVDFTDPSPVAPTSNVIGSARYPARIYQLMTGATQHAAAAAVIRIPAAMAHRFVDPAGDPYTTPDSPLINVVLKVERSGKKIFDDSINYDVAVLASPAPPITSLDGIPVSLYLGIGPAGTELGNIPYLTLPNDGSPPSYTDLDTVISEIVKADPGPPGPYDPANLTQAQCLHLAREIVSNRTANPLPVPSPELGTLYTKGSSATDQDRSQFSSKLQAYYATMNAQASRLATYIAAWSGAQNCASATKNATSAGFTFPVRLTSTAAAGQIAQATLVLHN